MEVDLPNFASGEVMAPSSRRSASCTNCSSYQNAPDDESPIIISDMQNPIGQTGITLSSRRSRSLSNYNLEMLSHGNGTMAAFMSASENKFLRSTLVNATEVPGHRSAHAAVTDMTDISIASDAAAARGWLEGVLPEFETPDQQGGSIGFLLPENNLPITKELQISRTLGMSIGGVSEDEERDSRQSRLFVTEDQERVIGGPCCSTHGRQNSSLITENLRERPVSLAVSEGSELDEETKQLALEAFSYCNRSSKFLEPLRMSRIEPQDDKTATEIASIDELLTAAPTSCEQRPISMIPELHRISTASAYALSEYSVNEDATSEARAVTIQRINSGSEGSLTASRVGADSTRRQHAFNSLELFSEDIPALALTAPSFHEELNINSPSTNYQETIHSPSSKESIVEPTHQIWPWSSTNIRRASDPLLHRRNSRKPHRESRRRQTVDFPEAYRAASGTSYHDSIRKITYEPRHPQVIATEASLQQPSISRTPSDATLSFEISAIAVDDVAAPSSPRISLDPDEASSVVSLRPFRQRARVQVDVTSNERSADPSEQELLMRNRPLKQSPQPISMAGQSSTARWPNESYSSTRNYQGRSRSLTNEQLKQSPLAKAFSAMNKCFGGR